MQHACDAINADAYSFGSGHVSVPLAVWWGTTFHGSAI